MASLSSRWTKPQTPGISERLNSVIKPKGALKPRIESAIKKLQAQTSKLDNMLSSLDSRNEKVFHRIVEATQQHDTHTNLNYFVIDCLRHDKHPSHFNLTEVIELTKILKPKKTILTNLHSDLDYNDLINILPKNIVPAYDGMSFYI